MCSSDIWKSVGCSDQSIYVLKIGNASLWMSVHLNGLTRVVARAAGAMTKKISRTYSYSQAGPHLFFFCVGERMGARAATRSAGVHVGSCMRCEHVTRTLGFRERSAGRIHAPFAGPLTGDHGQLSAGPIFSGTVAGYSDTPTSSSICFMRFRCMFHPYVACVSFRCCKSRFCVAYVAIASVYYKCFNYFRSCKCFI
jgi:hypothetical protein